MVTKSTAKKPEATKTKSKAAASRKKPTTKLAPKASKKALVKVSNKVDYYPNRMTLAVSVLAGTILVLVTIISVLGSRG